MAELCMLSTPQWYLARHVASANHREQLFKWLKALSVEAWTPLQVTKRKRTDSLTAHRIIISAVYPGYFFLKVNFSTQPIETIRRHSAFCGFVKCGSKIVSIQPSVIARLMKLHPEPSPNHLDKDNLITSSVKLTNVQYQYLVDLETMPHTSRIAILMNLVAELGQKGCL
jgi:transcription antitermination factor NusG